MCLKANDLRHNKIWHLWSLSAEKLLLNSYLMLCSTFKNNFNNIHEKPIQNSYGIKYKWYIKIKKYKWYKRFTIDCCALSMITKVQCKIIKKLSYCQLVFTCSKLKIKNARKWWEICLKLTKKDTRTTSIDMNKPLVHVVLVSFFLTLNIFCFLFYCLLC